MSLATDDFTIESIHTPEEYNQYFMDYQLKLNWNPSPLDCIIYKAFANYKNFKLAKYKGEVFMIFSFIKNKKERTVEFGSYITKPEFQSKGFSYFIWRKCYDKLRAKGYRFFAIAGSDMLDTYTKKLEVKVYGKIIDRVVTVENFPFFNPDLRKVITTGINLDQVTDYDKLVSGKDRGDVLGKMIGLDGVKTAVFLEMNKVKGYGMIRKGTPIWILQPLLADTSDIALALINTLLIVLDKHDQYCVASVEAMEQQKDTKHENQSDKNKTQLFWENAGFEITDAFFLVGHCLVSNDFSKTFGIFSYDFGI